MYNFLCPAKIIFLRITRILQHNPAPDAKVTAVLARRMMQESNNRQNDLITRD
jgi:hypothetical protein